MATKQAKIHFLATRGALPVKSTDGKPKSPGSNAIIIQDYDETKDKYVYAMIDVGYWRTTTGWSALGKYLSTQQDSLFVSAVTNLWNGTDLSIEESALIHTILSA